MKLGYPFLFAAVALMVSLVSGCDPSNPCKGNIAVVDSHPIATADYQTLFRYTLNYYKWGDPNSEYYNHDICKEYVFHRACATIKSSLRSRMIDQYLVEKYADSHGLAINAQDRKIAIADEDALKKKFGGGPGGELAFKVYLEKLHTSAKDFRKIELQQILTSKVQVHVVPFAISGPQVFVYQIFIPVGGPKLADKQLHDKYVKQARAQADKIAAQLRAGGNFAQYARQYSKDPKSSRIGGVLGWIARPGGDPQFNNELFALPKNTVSVVESHFGFHVVKVTDEQTLPYSGAALSAARQHAFANWVRSQLAKSSITRCN